MLQGKSKNMRWWCISKRAAADALIWSGRWNKASKGSAPSTQEHSNWTEYRSVLFYKKVRNILFYWSFKSTNCNVRPMSSMAAWDSVWYNILSKGPVKISVGKIFLRVNNFWYHILLVSYFWYHILRPSHLFNIKISFGKIFDIIFCVSRPSHLLLSVTGGKKLDATTTHRPLSTQHTTICDHYLHCYLQYYLHTTKHSNSNCHHYLHWYLHYYFQYYLSPLLFATHCVDALQWYHNTFQSR